MSKVFARTSVVAICVIAILLVLLMASSAWAAPAVGQLGIGGALSGDLVIQTAGTSISGVVQGNDTATDPDSSVQRTFRAPTVTVRLNASDSNFDKNNSGNNLVGQDHHRLERQLLD